MTDTAKVKNRFSENFSFNLASKAIYMLSRFILQPVTMAYVTLDEYGIWAACFILISYLGVSVLGVSNVYVRYVAEYNAKNDIEKISRLLSTGIIVVSGISIVSLAAVWQFLPEITSLFNVPPALQRTAAVFIFVTALMSMLDLSFGAFGSTLTGLQRGREQSILWLVVCSLEVVMIVLFLMRGWGIYSLLWAFVIRLLAAIPLNILMCYRFLPALSLSPRKFDRGMIGLFFRYGSIVQLTSLLGIFLFSIEKVLAGIFLGVGDTGLIDVGQKLAVTASILPAAMHTLLLPVMSHLNTLNQRREVGSLYLKGARYLNMMMGGLMGYLVAFSSPLIVAWMGADQKYQSAPIILMIFCLPYQLHQLTGVASAFHRSNQAARELVYPISQLLLVAIMVVGGFFWLGKSVLVICGAVGMSMVVSSLLYIAYSNRFLEIGNREFFTQVLLPGIIPYLIGVGLAWMARPMFAWAGTERWRLLLVLGGAGCVYAVLTSTYLYRVICGPGERESLRRQALHVFRKLLSFRFQPA